MKHARRICLLSRTSYLVWIAVLSLLTISRSAAEDGWEGRLFSFYWENDAIARSDRHYTQGAGFSYYTADDNFPRWMKATSTALPSVGLDVQAQKAGFVVAQEVYTPENLRTSALLKEDQPYAGWLFGSLILQRRGTGYREIPAIETLRVDIGVVGPESLAEETQKTWHGIDPKGWKNQLSFEPGLNVRYHRSYLLAWPAAGSEWRIDLIPYAAVDLGNISTLAKLGSTARLGYNIPNEFAAGKGDGRVHYGVYLFSGLEGRLVGRNIFLDGNSFNRSHSVDRIPWVGNFRTGMTLVLKRMEVTISHTFLTREFDEQKSSDSFGSAQLTYKF